MLVVWCAVLLACCCALLHPTPGSSPASRSGDEHLAALVHRLDTDDVTEYEPTFLREIRKYSRRLWHVNCSARLRRACHCYSRLLRQYFCCDCDSGPCFPGSARLHTPEGGSLTMEELRIGQLVLAADVSGQIMASRVLGFLDRRPLEEAVYTTLVTHRGHRLTLSDTHLVFVRRDNSSGDAESLPAGQVRPGHRLLVLPDHRNLTTGLQEDPVVHVEHALNTGAYVPLTEAGTLLVDGSLASCYASFPHQLAHLFLGPARLAPALLLDSEHSQLEHGVRLLPRVLKVLGRALLPPLHHGNPATRVLKFDLRL